MAEQVRGVAPTGNLSSWTPADSAGLAILAVDDDTYVESSPTANTPSGSLPVTSAFTIPGGATVNSVKVRCRVRLAAAGTRQVRCGFSGSVMGTVQNLSSTTFIVMNFDMPTDPATGLPWTANGVNTLVTPTFSGPTAYIRAYADADGPVVQAAWVGIVVDYTPTGPADPIPTIFAGNTEVVAIKVGATNIARVMAGADQIWPEPGASLRMTVTGTSFSPELELRAGSTATVTWVADGATIDNAGSLTPTITWAGAGPHVVRLHLSDRDAITTLNFGFNAADDAGVYSPGAGYNHTAQNVTSIQGLRRLTGLKRFLAANGPMSGTLDFTGCSSLEYIECFEANVGGLVLDGCPSLIRLCIEACNVSLLDINPCRASLRDLRAAAQQGAVLEFVPVTGLLSNLYHFCTRSQYLINNPTLDQMPVIQQWWVWDCGIVIPGVPTSTLLNSCLAHNNDLGEAAVDALLVYIEDNVPAAAGNVRLEGNAAPSATGEAAATALIARGSWSVTTETVGGGDPPEEPAGFDENTVTAALSKRWIFAHQSVGMQVIQGIQAWCDVYNLPDPTIIDVESGSIPGSGGYLGHWYVGTNGDGFSKVSEFDSMIRGGLHADADVFVMKFCYADLRPSSGYTPAQLFAAYESTLDGLIADYPSKTFILATETIVMEADEDGPANSLRMTFNDLVRAKYGATGYLWDIALALSTDPDGNRIRTGTSPNFVEHLYSGYASPDQEHISGPDSIGRRTAAVPLLQILAVT